MSNGDKTVKPSLAIGGMVLSAVVGLGVARGLDVMINDKAHEYRVQTIEERLDYIEQWGPRTGDRWTRDDALEEWKHHEKDHDRIERKIDRLLAFHGLSRDLSGLGGDDEGSAGGGSSSAGSQ